LKHSSAEVRACPRRSTSWLSVRICISYDGWSLSYGLRNRPRHQIRMLGRWFLSARESQHQVVRCAMLAAGGLKPT
jgi:hypothetical protein